MSIVLSRKNDILWGGKTTANSLITQSHKTTSYFYVRQKSFMCTSPFITQIIAKMYTAVKLIILTVSSKTFISETECNNY